MNRGALDIVLEEYVPDDANIVEWLFVLDGKNVGNKEQICKECFSTQGLMNVGKSMLVHVSTNIWQ